MCNLYIMYYTDREKGSEFSACGMETYPMITKNLPPDSDVPLPPNPILEEHAKGENLHKVRRNTYLSIFLCINLSISINLFISDASITVQGYDHGRRVSTSPCPNAISFCVLTPPLSLYLFHACISSSHPYSI